MTENEIHVQVRFEDDSFWATVEEFPGVFATGDTLEELRESLEEGIALALARPDEDPPAIRLNGLHPEPVSTSAAAQLIYA